VIHAPARAGEVSRIYLNAEKARLQLGWEPRVEFREGLARTIEFFRKGQPR
jgi:nucleoside-diphosphate-sugar epimerase